MFRALTIAAKTLLTGGNLKCLALRPHAAVHYAGECLFLDRVMHPNGDLPQKHVWEALGISAEVPIVIRPQVSASEWFGAVASYAADMIELCALAHLLQPRIIFEIGTYSGASAIQLVTNAPDALLFSLDLAPEDSPSLPTTVVDRVLIGRHQFAQLDSRIRRLYGDSATFDFSPFHRRVDLFFIDGAHSYEYVRNDTMKALECVHGGSVIAWHDYGRCGVNGVSRWLHEFRQGRELYRVPGGSLAYMLCS